jgi:hypothetical protein
MHRISQAVICPLIFLDFFMDVKCVVTIHLFECVNIFLSVFEGELNDEKGDC